MSVALVFEKDERIPDTRLRYQEELPKKNNRRMARFMCDCGKVIDRDLHWVRHLNITSCGCYKSELVRSKNTRHSNANRSGPTGAYRSWAAMLRRVSVDPKYKDRTICSRWLGEDGFMNFLSDMGPRPDGYSIERLNNNLGYNPGNCIWGDRETQANNRSINVNVSIDGVTRTLAQWCRVMEIPYYLVKQRRRRGMSIEDSLRTPINESKRGKAIGRPYRGEL